MMQRRDRNGVACIAPNSSRFLALAADGFSAEFFGQGLQCCLDGNIEINNEPPADPNGSGKDTIVEALLHQYRIKDEEFLKDVRGSFRLALWDPEKQKLLLAVDPFATRPFYYSCAKGMLVFAPRISCFSALPEISKEVDANGLYFYLNHS